MTSSMQHFNQSPPIYQQPPMSEPFWAQEALHSQTYPQEMGASLVHQYDFNNISTELFQPEEIFQVDHAAKPDFVQTTSQTSATDAGRSPPTLLDLGSGTIHREFKTEDYWNNTLSNMLINDDSNNSSNSRFNVSQSPDNSQIMLNNNVTPVDPHLYLGSKLDEDHFPSQKTQYYPQHTLDSNYKSFEYVDSKMSYFLEDKVSQNFEAFQNSKTYPKSNYPDEYIDLGQYNDYNAYLSVYDNSKINTDNSVFNDLDFRINTSVPSISNVHSNYSHDNFDVISHQ